MTFCLKTSSSHGSFIEACLWPQASVTTQEETNNEENEPTVTTQEEKGADQEGGSIKPTTMNEGTLLTKKTPGIRAKTIPLSPLKKMDLHAIVIHEFESDNELRNAKEKQ